MSVDASMPLWITLATMFCGFWIGADLVAICLSLQSLGTSLYLGRISHMKAFARPREGSSLSNSRFGIGLTIGDRIPLAMGAQRQLKIQPTNRWSLG